MRAPKRQDPVRPRPGATLNVAGGLSVQFCTLSAWQPMRSRVCADNAVRKGTGSLYSGPFA
jgi:hypothetical protein